ncbi:hypothetical protein OCQ_33130 [Mycobacterium paraintracellulare]|nr:hypothetical protein OCQ_33130 [Mycobacterium paraintracellulare]
MGVRDASAPARLGRLSAARGGAPSRARSRAPGRARSGAPGRPGAPADTVSNIGNGY